MSFHYGRMSGLSPDFPQQTYVSAILHVVPHQGRRRTRRAPLHQIPANSEVKFFLFPSDYINVLLSIYFVCLPKPVGEDKYTFVHLLKESPYPALDALPINPILFNAHIPSYLFILLLIHVQIRHQRNLYQQNM